MPEAVLREAEGGRARAREVETSPCRLSVAIVTHNHERFIGEAIDSVLAQKTSFPFELVIGDDASTDGTPRILREYASRHSNIRLLASGEKLGMAGNYFATVSACRGDFVAMLDGDDYWASPDKLERQVAFLDSHPQCTLCFHNVTKVFEGTSRPSVLYCSPTQKAFSDLRDLLAENFLPTSSVVYRRDPNRPLPAWLLDLRFVDWPLHMLNVRRGQIGYLEQPMGVYRIHPQGDWISMDVEEKTRGIIQIYENVEKTLEPAYRRQVRGLLSMRYFQLARHEHRRGDRAASRSHLWRAFALERFRPRRDRLSLLADLYAPILRRIWTRLKKTRRSHES